MSRWLTIGLLVLSLVGCSGERQYPDQPISLICPWSAGGGTDRVARQVAAQLESELSVPVNVINATGGSGVTGHTRGAIARPDGYTLTMITVELSMLHWRGLTSVTHKDFAPLQLLNRDPAALFVRGDSAFQTLDDLLTAVDSASGSGKKLKASGTAYGGIWHIATAGWLDHRGLPPDGVNWISINGAGPSVQELLAGGVDFICCSLPEADAVLAGGQVRCLGVMSDERVGGFEDVPTFKEQGHDWSIAGWRGLAAPRGTPPERMQVLSAAVARVTATESFREFMATAGFDLSLEGPDEFAATLQRQDRLFGDILTSEALRGVSGEHFGPLMFPAITAVALLLTLLIVIVEHRRERGGEPEVAQVNTPSQPSGGGELREQAPAAQTRFLYPAAVAVAVMFYAVASEPLGFVATAILMLTGLMLALRVPVSVAVSVAVMTGLVTYQVFGMLLRVPLPRSFLEW